MTLENMLLDMQMEAEAHETAQSDARGSVSFAVAPMVGPRPSQLLTQQHPHPSWRYLVDDARTHRTALLIIAACALLGAAVVGAWMPVGAQAGAVLSSANVSRDQLQAEANELGGVEIAAAMVDQVDSASLLRCDLAATPLPLLRSVCIHLPGESDRDLALAAAHQAVTISLDEAHRVLRMVVQQADPQVASAMLQGALAHDGVMRAKMLATAPSTLTFPELNAARRELADIEKDLSEFSANPKTYDPVKQWTTALANDAALANRQSDLQQRFSATKAQLAKAEELIKVTPEHIIATRDTTRRKSTETATQALMRLRMDRVHVESNYANGYGLDELDRKIKVAQEHVREPSVNQQTKAREQINPAYAALSLTIASMTPAAEGMAAQLQALADQRARLAEQAEDARGNATRLEDLQRRRQTQSVVVQELTTSAARAQVESASAAAGLADMHWIVEPTEAAWPRAMRLLGAGLGSVLGALGCLMVLTSRGQFRKSYADPRDAEPHLDAPHLATITLDAQGRMGTLPRALAARIMRGLDVSPGDGSAPLVSIHLVGTCKQDGSGEVAIRVARSLATFTGHGVLLAEISKVGQDHIESFWPERRSATAPGGEDDAHEGTQRTPPPVMSLHKRAVQPVTSAVELICALMEAPRHYGAAMDEQLMRLKADHRVMLIVSKSDGGTDLPLPTCCHPDATLLVLHAHATSRAVAQRLTKSLSRRGEQPFGFVFTRDQPVY